MSKGKIRIEDILKAIAAVTDDLTGYANTKDIVLECGDKFPNVHMMTVLAIMGGMKRDGLVMYKASEMAWQMTADGRRRMRNG